MSYNADPSSLPAGYGGVLRFTLASIVFAFVMFVVMGVFGLSMRIEQSGLLNLLEPELFYQIMTLHGLSMVSLALLGSIGGFAAVIGRRVALDTRWLWMTFFFFFMGMMFVLFSTLGGGFAAAWTALYPLPFHGGYAFWGVVGATVGIGFVLIGFLIYSVLLIRSVSRAHGGVRNALGWPLIFQKTAHQKNLTILDVLAVSVALPGVLCVVTGFVWLIPLWMQASGLVQSIDVLFMKNFDYLFGHLLVNLTIYFSAGLMYFLLPAYTGRPWHLSRIYAIALNSITFLVPIIYLHHLYQDFAQPLGLQVVGQIGTYASVIPVILITLFGGLSQYYRSGIQWDVTTILLAIGLWGWMFGGMAAALDATIAVNQVMHNTLWVPGHLHTYFLLGAVIFLWAFLLYITRTLSGSGSDPRTRYAAVAYGIGGIGFTLMFLASGAYSVPRRYAVHLPDWQIFSLTAVPFIILLGLGVIWMGYAALSRVARAWESTAGPVDILPPGGQ
ncbi:MAG: cbb3-type cytochrome c oxidase subunit I [Methanomicrobiales archaeon]|nr:cbb3-type cytochrome c oxidase subunit I [Methanomicrobiales archaeon]